MAATPKNGTMVFFGTKSRRNYSVNVYVSDVAAAKVTLSSRGKAGTSSDTFWTAPEPVILTDFSMTTGTADTTNITLLSDDNLVPGAVLDYVPHVSTSAMRPALNIGFRQGAKIGALQA